MLFAPYKRMTERLCELLATLGGRDGPPVPVRITASPDDLPPSLAAEPWLEFLGRISYDEIRAVWARSRAIYFPDRGLESFGYPLAEARVSQGIP